MISLEKKFNYLEILHSSSKKWADIDLYQIAIYEKKVIFI
jgi:hypothetical protein